jgi:hypothetical protein
MALLQLRLRQLGHLLFLHCPALHKHLEDTNAQMMIFTSPWLLSVFSSEVIYDAIVKTWATPQKLRLSAGDHTLCGQSMKP